MLFCMKWIYFILYRLAILAFSILVVTLHVFDNFWPWNSNRSTRIQEYDFIIVGGGTAGSVLAARLSEDPKVTVLLLEAGIKGAEFLNIPALGTLYQQTSFDWSYRTVPQKFSCMGLKNQTSIWPAGKMLGGSTHLNYMLYVRGSKDDFIEWKDVETNEWSYEDVLYYFKKSEQYIDSKSMAGMHSISSGTLKTRETIFSTPFSDAVLRGAKELGYDTTDINEGDGTGFTKPQVNINKNGKRFTSDQNLKYKPNLNIMTGASVVKIVFKYNYEAVGVQVGETVYIARREVVLSAGTIGSSKLLMLSGVGPKQHLNSLKIEVIADLPVGQNLQDHVTTGLDLIKLQHINFDLSSLLSAVSVWKYYTGGVGAWTSAMCEVVGVVNTHGCGLPDVQLMVMVAGLSSDGGLFMRKCMGISDKLWDNYFQHLKDENVATILPVVLHPKSVGEVKLSSPDPTHQPIINPNYLSHMDDVAVLIRGIRLIQKLLKTNTMKAFGATFNNLPLPGCEHLEFDTDVYWECYVRHLTITSYHPIGTCKLGSSVDGTSVVDHRLRVHKLNKLRVIDGSVLPTLPSGNINAAIVMIAEKGADMIKEDYYTSRGTCSRFDNIVTPRLCAVN